MRWLRLALGGILLYEAILTLDFMIGIVAAFFLFQAFTNTGCGGSQGCATPLNRSRSDSEFDFHYKEIKK
jgi:hypothetical protein